MNRHEAPRSKSESRESVFYVWITTNYNPFPIFTHKPLFHLPNNKPHSQYLFSSIIPLFYTTLLHPVTPRIISTVIQYWENTPIHLLSMKASITHSSKIWDEKLRISVLIRIRKITLYSPEGRITVHARQDVHQRVHRDSLFVEPIGQFIEKNDDSSVEENDDSSVMHRDESKDKSPVIHRDEPIEELSGCSSRWIERWFINRWSRWTDWWFVIHRDESKDKSSVVHRDEPMNDSPVIHLDENIDESSVVHRDESKDESSVVHRDEQIDESFTVHSSAASAGLMCLYSFPRLIDSKM